MTIRFLISAVASAILLAACDQPSSSGSSPPPATAAAPRAADPPPFDYEAWSRDPAAMTMDQVKAYIADRTRNYYGPGHGTQISYSRPDGTTFLWYPGNRVVLPGEWKVEPRTGPLRGREQTVMSLCYKYGENTYNPMTGSRGAVWSCLPAGIWFKDLVETRAGDIFGLSRPSSPPFVLNRERTTFDELLRKR